MNELPPLEELLKGVEITKVSPQRPRIRAPVGYVFVPIDRWATDKIFEINPNARVYEIQTFFVENPKFHEIRNKTEKLIVPSARQIYQENPGKQMVFCSTIQGYRVDRMFGLWGYDTTDQNVIPKIINRYLPDITRKMTLYVGGDDNSRLKRLLGAH